MHAIFKKKGKKILKKGKVSENWGKNLQNLKMFWKGAGDYVQLLPCWNSIIVISTIKYTNK